MVALRMETRLESGAAVAKGTAAPAMELGLEGLWVETLVGGSEGAARYRVHVEGAKVLASSEQDGAGDLRAELALPFFVERDHEGATKAFFFARVTGAAARGILKTAAAMMQVVARSGQAWTTKEQDPTGEYEARYTRSADGLGVEKVRVRYTRLVTTRGLRPTEDVGTAEIKGTTRMQLTAQGELETLAATTQTAVQIGASMPRALGTLALSLTFRDRRVVTSLVGDFDRTRGDLERVEMIAKVDVSATAEARREAGRWGRRRSPT